MTECKTFIISDNYDFKKYFFWMVGFFKTRKNGSSESKGKTIIMLSGDKVYSLRINRFFQYFILFAIIVVSSFVTYYVTIYTKAQSDAEEKDHQIFVGDTINKNLSGHLHFILDEVNRLTDTLSDISPNLKVNEGSFTSKASKTNRIVTEADLETARAKIKKTILGFDKTIDQKNHALAKLIKQAGLSNLLESKKISDYETHKSNNIQVIDINYSGKEIASAVFSEAKYKLEYHKVLKDLVKSLPTATPIKGIRVTSHYGVRYHPLLKSKIFHHGLDFKAPKKATVHATVAGVVKFSGFSNSFGKVIMLDHGSNIMTIYAHLSDSKVKTGDRVQKNDIIGFQGSTGRSTGEHLHYEIRYKGKSLNPTNFIRMQELLKK